MLPSPFSAAGADQTDHEHPLGALKAEVVNDNSALAGALRHSADALSAIAASLESLNGTADGAALNIRTVTAMVSQVLFGIKDLWSSSNAPQVAATDALEAVSASTARLRELATLSEQIGVVVTTIEDITRTTNLLALNAAIEAARAGEMGRGFGVVATEVKNLSRQTASATVEIRAKVERIQAATAGATAAMQASAASVNKIHEMVAQVTAAVREQDDLTNAARTAVDEAAESAAQVATELAELQTRVGDEAARAHAALEHESGKD